jgi:hypothetical protein
MLTVRAAGHQIFWVIHRTTIAAPYAVIDAIGWRATVTTLPVITHQYSRPGFQPALGLQAWVIAHGALCRAVLVGQLQAHLAECSRQLGQLPSYRWD